MRPHYLQSQQHRRQLGRERPSQGGLPGHPRAKGPGSRNKRGRYCPGAGGQRFPYSTVQSLVPEPPSRRRDRPFALAHPFPAAPIQAISVREQDQLPYGFGLGRRRFRGIPVSDVPACTPKSTRWPGKVFPALSSGANYRHWPALAGQVPGHAQASGRTGPLPGTGIDFPAPCLQRLTDAM